jgi:hypothetical protein
MTQTPDSLRAAIATLAERLAGRPLDGHLEAWLNREHGVGSATYAVLKAHCEAGEAAGWLCGHKSDGVRYGRVLKPAPDLFGFSVDVVDMDNVAGPHHVHPNGEIDCVMPVAGEALFDGRPAGWLVYPPGSGHTPTVSGGRAFVLYLLPEGKIRFT